MTKFKQTRSNFNKYGLKKVTIFYIWDALRGLVPFVQFKKREKDPWKSVIPFVFHWCFSRFLNCKNVTKSSKALHRVLFLKFLLRKVSMKLEWDFFISRAICVLPLWWRRLVSLLHEWSKSIIAKQFVNDPCEYLR